MKQKTVYVVHRSRRDIQNKGLKEYVICEQNQDTLDKKDSLLALVDNPITKMTVWM